MNISLLALAYAGPGDMHDRKLDVWTNEAQYAAWTYVLLPAYQEHLDELLKLLRWHMTGGTEEMDDRKETMKQEFFEQWTIAAARELEGPIRFRAQSQKRVGP